MKCAWEPLMAVLPPELRREVTKIRQEDLREIRMRVGQRVEWNLGRETEISDPVVSRLQINHVINAASRYSPWAVKSMDKGYLTIDGGHRIGLGGQVGREGGTAGFRDVDSLCIRVARDIPGAAERYEKLQGSVLIIGAPGWGKTTMLRDLARRRAEKASTAVIDEREELFPRGFARGKRMDVLSGCGKEKGLEMALRTLGPEQIALDEITGKEDCDALRYAAHCGVTLLATAHASSREDLFRREVYRPLAEQGIFDYLVIMRKDQTSFLERMGT